jgi:glycosyltransferase involved in cell wall biosynthesis
VRVLIDYRPALRERSGVGEYVFQLSRALLAAFPSGHGVRGLDLTLLSSSWKDRVPHDAGLEGAAIVDRRVPVRLLNFLWHRLEWPPAEMLSGGAFDVAHSPHPLLLPARSAARVVTIHDLYFLTHPERSQAEVRRDYPRLARAHAQRADQIIVPSQFTALDVQRRLDVPAERISVCPHGRPPWAARTNARAAGYVLCFGTLEPRKNVAGLLDAYERLLESAGAGSRGACLGGDRRKHNGVPELVLAGHAPQNARPCLDRLTRAPLQGVVRHVGYVDPDRRHQLYEGARLLVQPSFEEGFGFPVLEAMTMGVPVVAANRGALPEVLGDAGLLVDPTDPDAMASAISRMLSDETLATSCAARGALRARQFDWSNTAQQVHAAYQLAIGHRQCASA